MSETKPHIDEYVHEDYAAIERKFLPVDGVVREKLDKMFKDDRTRITQLQLSHPSEPYGLCMRKHTPERVPDFRVEIKNVGIMTDEGLRRMQISADIDRDLFESYEHMDVPTTKKWRAYPLGTKDVHIDFFDNGHVHAKSRNPDAWTEFVDTYDLAQDFRDITGNMIVDSEWHAHNDYKREHGGREVLAQHVGPTLKKAVAEINAWRDVRTGKPFVQVSGRSGSGKSTFASRLQKELVSQQQPLRAIVLSTDEYNRGRTELYKRGGGSWTNYDSDEVWDTIEFREDMEKLRRGESIPHWQFDYDTEERVMLGMINPADYDVFIYEGVKAHHTDLHNLADLAYEIATPLATSLGRRIVRDLMERPRFADPATNLVYYLTYAEPEYSRLYAA